MKNLETFFELSNYDKKNILNRGDKIIEQATLDKIESQGATLEDLIGLGVPVFKYQTQITIHGYFPEVKHNYIGGYKNLFQNKNLSIGVKWQAVDYRKKEHIYSTIRNFSKGWSVQHNSTDYYIYKTSETFRDKETYRTLLEKATSEINYIDKALFFGNCGVFLSQTLWGGYFLVSYINIGAILQENVDKCIENICKAPINEISAYIQRKEDERKQAEAERAAKYEQELQERKAKQLPLIEAAREQLTSSGYTLQEKTPIEQGKIYIKIGTDIETGKFHFTAYKFSKKPTQRKWRYIKADANGLTFEFTGYEQETMNNTFTGYVLPTVKIETIKETVKMQTGAVKVINYSDKALAIFGDTRPLKDKLKDIGARFNPFLTIEGIKQAGWVLPISQREKLTFINN